MNNKPVEKGHLVTAVRKNTPAEKAGIKPGWRLLRVDNQPIKDILDYRILTADDQVKMLFLTDTGPVKRVSLQLHGTDSVGLEFESPAIAPLQRCPNRCKFCFVDQNPAGMRETLYVKDDDYRLSFLYGNFITLNRLNDSELKRILKLQLSPLYVSVHTTDPALRSIMFGTKRAAKGLDYLKQLIRGGIRIHAQIVLCPGYNTGPKLYQTLADLDAMGENLLSVALVPVGLTAHRSGLDDLEPVTGVDAAGLIDKIEALQKLYLKRRGSRFVFLADELYNLAGLSYPPRSEYEEFPQLENGVGLARLFLDELVQLKDQLPESLKIPVQVTLVTGQSARQLIGDLADLFSKVDGLQVNVEVAINRFFGDTVTVAGLLTGSDLIAALADRDCGNLILISQALLKDQSNLFLDNQTLSTVEDILQTPVVPATGPIEAWDKINSYNLEQIASSGGA